MLKLHLLIDLVWFQKIKQKTETRRKQTYNTYLPEKERRMCQEELLSDKTKKARKEVRKKKKRKKYNQHYHPPPTKPNLFTDPQHLLKVCLCALPIILLSRHPPCVCVGGWADVRKESEHWRGGRKDKPSKLRAFMLSGSILRVSLNQARASSLFLFLFLFLFFIFFFEGKIVVS